MRHPFLLFILLPAILGALLPAVSYFSNYENAISAETRKLVDIGKLAANLLDEKLVLSAKERYAASDPQLAAGIGLEDLSRVLRSIQSSHRLPTDIALSIRPDWKSDQKLFIAMGGDKPYIGNNLPLNSEALKAWESRKPTARLWSDDSDRFLTAYVPMLGQKGDVLALVETNRSVADLLGEIRGQWMRDTLVGEGVLFLLSLLFFLYWKRARKDLFGKLREALFAAFPKEKITVAPDLNEESLSSTLLSHTHLLREQKEALEKQNRSLNQKFKSLEGELAHFSQELNLLLGSPVPILAFDVRGTCVVASDESKQLFSESAENRDISKLLNVSGKSFEQAYERVMANPSQLAVEAVHFPSELTSPSGSRYRLSYKVWSDTNGHSYLMAVARESDHERMLEEEALTLKEQMELLQAVARHRQGVTQFLVEIFSWVDCPASDVVVRSFLLAKAFHLESLSRQIEPLVADRSVESWNRFCSSRKKLWRQFEETVERQERRGGERVKRALYEYVSFWRDYFEVLCTHFKKENCYAIEIEGEEFVANWKNCESLLFALVQGVENAVEHGIEPAEERKRFGKKPVGSIKVSFDLFESANGEPWCIVRIADDGSGISSSKLRNELRAFAIDTSGDTDHNVLQHLFEEGVSTRVAPTERWTKTNGLNRIYALVKEHNGVCEIDSVSRQGTTLTVMFPLESLAVQSVTRSGQAVTAVL